MKRFDILTIFPQMFESFASTQIYRRSAADGMFQIKAHDLREFTTDRHRTVDDTPYGGGAGMVMKAEPLVAALEKVTDASVNSRRIYLTPKGKRWSQKQAERLLKYDQLVILCGRYRGVDQRVIDGWVDEEISMGNFILSGGELAAMIVVETMVRLIPGVLGNPESLQGETRRPSEPEAPQYTRPPIFRGMEVPAVLTSGNHRQIAAWRQQQSRPNPSSAKKGKK